MSRKQKGGVWEYLRSIPGLLEMGSDEDIRKHKEAYWRMKNTQYKASRRKEQPEHVIRYTETEHAAVMERAKQHGISVSGFIKAASLRDRIVPDIATIRKIETELSRTLTAIERIAGREKKNWFVGSGDFDELKRHVIDMRREVQAFRNL